MTCSAKWTECKLNDDVNIHSDEFEEVRPLIRAFHDSGDYFDKTCYGFHVKSGSCQLVLRSRLARRVTALGTFFFFARHGSHVHLEFTELENVADSHTWPMRQSWWIFPQCASRWLLQLRVHPSDGSDIAASPTAEGFAWEQWFLKAWVVRGRRVTRTTRI